MNPLNPHPPPEGFSVGKIPSPRFARIPETLLNDPALTLTDLKVFGQMAMLCIDTNIVTIGQRRLAELTRLEKRNLVRSLDNLAKLGYVSRAIGFLSGRTVYQLNSPIFLATAEKSTGTHPYSKGIHVVKRKKT